MHFVTLCMGINYNTAPLLSLVQVPGGYFVRHQDGDFKYLVAFNAPEVWAGEL